MSEEKKKLVPLGRIVEEIRKKEPEILKLADVSDRYIDQIVKCINLTAEDAYKKYNRNFIIEVRIRRNVMFPEKIRTVGTARLTLPYPTYDQLNFLYHKNTDTLKPLWQLPCQSACDILISGGPLTPSEEKLVPQIKCFRNGDLHRVADDYNRQLEIELRGEN